MHFRPSITLTLILIILALAFLRLGLWQLDRKAEKAALFAEFDGAPSLGIERALEREAAWARVEAFGRYDPERHVLLDNRIWNRRAGVHVLTPFQLTDGRWLLVNRGWLPLPANRQLLPQVPTDAAPRTINGRLAVPATGGPRLGEPDVLANDRWPQLVTYLDTADIAEALDAEIEPWIVLLDSADVSGFGDRQWSAAVMGPEVHGAYAVQWLALSAATVIIWITVGWRRGATAAAAAEADRRDSGEKPG